MGYPIPINELYNHTQSILPEKISMAIVVLDLKIHSIPAQFSNLGAYQTALILLRLGKLPARD